MALISRIFQNRNKSRNQSCKWVGSSGKDEWHSPGLDKSQIRLVLFRDHDIKGRKLLFDSSTVQIEPQQSRVRTSARLIRTGPLAGQSCGSDGGMAPNVGNRYSYLKASSDTTILGEMMYGSVAMSYRGSTLKVHEIRSPPQLMVSKVFSPTPPNRETSSSDVDRESFDGYSISSLSSDSAGRPISSERTTIPMTPLTMSHSIPVEIPSPMMNQSIADEDSGFAASVASSASSFGTSFPSPGSAPGSVGSFTGIRRYRRSVDTSLEYYIPKRQSEENIVSVPASKRPCKFGLGVLFKLPDDPDKRRHLEKFMFSHITLVESHLNKLQFAMEKVLSQAHNDKTSNRMNTFIHHSLEALEVFRESLFDLYMAPRLTEPVWLNMMCFSMQRVKLCQRFIKDFMGAIEKLDTKNNKFFVSSMLTAVLTYHLAWVPTVTPAGGAPSRTYLDKHSAKWLDTLARSHPYNPLWAQLGDLYGAIGFPLRLCRTVVVGKKADTVCKMLYLLSYFIRCSEVLESTLDCPLQSYDNDAGDGLSLSGEMSPIRESGLSRNNSEDSMSGLPPGLVADLAVEASESPPKRDSWDSVTSPGDSVFHSQQFSTSSAHFRSISENTIVNSPVSPNRTDSEGTTCGSDAMENSTMFKSDSTVMSVQSDKTLSPSASCDNVPLKDPNPESDVYDKDILTKETETANVKECRLSQTSIEEIRRKDSVRNVGREAVCTVFYNDEISAPETPQKQSTDDLIGMDESDIDSNACDAPNGCTIDSGNNMEQYSQDSGVYEGSCAEYQTASVNGSESPCPEETEKGEGNLADSRTQEPKDVIENKDTIKVVYTRNMSMFDEYFPDGEITPTGIPKVQMRTPQNYENFKCKRMGIIEGSNGTMDEFMHEYEDEPLPNVVIEKLTAGKSSLEKERISLKEEYFKEDVQSVMPSGNASEQIQHAIQLMKQKSRDDGLASGEVGISTETTSLTEAGSGRKSRPTSLTLNSISRPLSRQDSNSKTPSSSKRSGRSTPVESGRRRHASSLSTASSIEADFFLNLQELPMANSDELDEAVQKATYERHFGRSLMAAYTDHYMSDFVLHGTSDTNFHSRLHSDLMMAVQNSVVDEPIAESVCIIADTDKWSVQVHSCQYSTPDRVHKQEVVASQFVLSIIDSLRHLNKLKMSPESCLMHLEDRLQEIYFKSIMLGEYMCQHKKIDMKELSIMLGFDLSDLPLLLAVAGTHTPHLAMGL